MNHLDTPVTGIAVIIVDDNGQNSIVLIGANGVLSPDDVTTS